MDRKVLWSTIDFRGNIVEYDSYSHEHIHAQRGGDFDLIAPLIEPTVNRPTMLIQSTLSDDTYIYSGWDVCQEARQKMWLHVVVGFQLSIGRVETAYFSPGQKHGTIVYCDWTNRL